MVRTQYPPWMLRGVFVAFGLLLTDLCLDYVLFAFVNFLASLVTDGLWILFATSSNIFQYTCSLYPRAGFTRFVWH
jgi:hypothetical protein